MSADNVGGMGAMLHVGGVAFRVWAPHAQQVHVIGSFNDWDGGKNPMQSEGNGNWYADIAEAHAGDEYRYLLRTDKGEFSRIDPYARQVTNSVGNGVIHDPAFDWGKDLPLAPWNEIVIYELHVGTFSDDKDDNLPGDLYAAAARLGQLSKLGVNALEIMPVGQFAGDWSWGYNPSQIFAVDSTYGGLKRFVKRAHEHGLAVILDVVYNHFGPSDLDLWQFDGWSENNLGGIYFYNDGRASTPWGATRPDYGRGEVRQYIRDNALMWLDEYHIDGLRVDGTAYIRSVDGSDGQDLPDGWSLLQWLNTEIAKRYPGRITIAEDLFSNPWLTKDVGAGGAGFGAQWDANFVHPIRQVMAAPDDAQRSLSAVRDALCYRYNDDAFDRVIYSESHDEVASGKARVPQEVDGNDPEGWCAQKRSTLAAALVLAAPGIPMLFQGQEFLEGGWFRDTVPLDWDLRDEFHGIVRLYRDLIRLRLNRDGFSRGLCGQSSQIYHVNEERKILAFHRWDKGGPGDDVVVVVNLLHEAQNDYVIGFPTGGTWKLRFNSDWRGYSDVFADHPSTNVMSEAGEQDGLPFHGTLSLGAYSVLIFSQ
jgi:1,4-alpha-glucan branching enzyme